MMMSCHQGVHGGNGAKGWSWGFPVLRSRSDKKHHQKPLLELCFPGPSLSTSPSSLQSIVLALGHLTHGSKMLDTLQHFCVAGFSITFLFL